MKHLLVVVLLLLFSGCATVGGPSVQTPREGIASCYSTVQVAYKSAVDLRARGQLSDANRAKVLEVGEKALAVCDTARIALAAGDSSKAQGQLVLAQTLLLQLETLLKEQK